MAASLGAQTLTTPAPVFSVEAALELVRRAWGLDAPALTALPSERDWNAMLGGHVLKLANPAEDPATIDMENAVLAHLRAVAPELPVPRLLPAKDGEPTVTVLDDEGRPCLARLITVVPGTHLEGVPITATLAEQVGAICARSTLALQGLFHPAAGRAIDWDVRRAPDLMAGDDVPAILGLTPAATDELRERLARAAAATGGLASGLNHADVTLTNVLGEGDRVTGLIDFGDLHHTAHVCDLAVTLTSVIRNTAEVQLHGTWALADAVLRGYQRHRPIDEAELAVLGDLILARLVLTLVISARRTPEHADNTAYITQYDDSARRLFAELHALDPDELTARLGRLGGLRPDAPGDLLDRRRAVMGGALSPLFYADPIEVVRGEGAWLIDERGERYLDAYNNVAVVGHAHPAVTNAVARQLGRINTHSRYLHEGIVTLAERLVATMPSGLDTCLFTTSGTEANDLAWRLAIAHTGGSGAIVAEHGYHGASKWQTDLSSMEWPEGYRPPHVATFAAPRGPGCDASAARSRVLDAAARLADAGDRAALVLADLAFTSEGVVDSPAPFVQGLVEGAHAAGALFLADEVQSGFGRSGPQLWRFGLYGVTPDFVTLGKPMGAGYPIGAVITRREIADSLARDYEYFSTFAATPAAAAAGNAVLDILLDTGLPSSAVATGDYLRARLRSLASVSPLLGEVRGVGLMAGVDVVPPAGVAPRAFAKEIVNRLRHRRVLVSNTGPTGGVLKIRPPLVWTSQHVDLLHDALASVLAE